MGETKQSTYQILVEAVRKGTGLKDTTEDLKDLGNQAEKTGAQVGDAIPAEAPAEQTKMRASVEALVKSFEKLDPATVRSVRNLKGFAADLAAVKTEGNLAEAEIRAITAAEEKLAAATKRVSALSVAQVKLNEEIGATVKSQTLVQEIFNDTAGPVGKYALSLGMVSAALRKGWEMGMKFNEFLGVSMKEFDAFKEKAVGWVRGAWANTLGWAFTQLGDAIAGVGREQEQILQSSSFSVAAQRASDLADAARDLGLAYKDDLGRPMKENIALATEYAAAKDDLIAKDRLTAEEATKKLKPAFDERIARTKEETAATKAAAEEKLRWAEVELATNGETVAGIRKVEQAQLALAAIERSTPAEVAKLQAESNKRIMQLRLEAAQADVELNGRSEAALRRRMEAELALAGQNAAKRKAIVAKFNAEIAAMEQERTNAAEAEADRQAEAVLAANASSKQNTLDAITAMLDSWKGGSAKIVELLKKKGELEKQIATETADAEKKSEVAVLQEQIGIEEERAARAKESADIDVELFRETSRQKIELQYALDLTLGQSAEEATRKKNEALRKLDDEAVKISAQNAQTRAQQIAFVVNGVQQLVAGLSSYLQATADAEAAKVDARYKREEARVKARYDAEIKAAERAGRSTTQIAARRDAELLKLDAAHKKQIDKIRKKEFEQEQKLKLVQATMSGAQMTLQMGSQSGYVGYILGALLTALQVATILSQKYVPQAATGAEALAQDTLLQAHKGERIIPAHDNVKFSAFMDEVVADRRRNAFLAGTWSRAEQAALIAPAAFASQSGGAPASGGGSNRPMGASAGSVTNFNGPILGSIDQSYLASLDRGDRRYRRLIESRDRDEWARPQRRTT